MGRKGDRLPGVVLSLRECHALLDACGPDWFGRRFRTLLVLLWRGGLRIAEALAVSTRDVDLATGVIHIRRGKGGWPRLVALDPQAVEVLKAWLRERAQLSQAHWRSPGPLLCTRHGRPLSPIYCRREIKRVAERAGIHSRVNLHG